MMPEFSVRFFGGWYASALHYAADFYEFEQFGNLLKNCTIEQINFQNDNKRTPLIALLDNKTVYPVKNLKGLLDVLDLFKEKGTNFDLTNAEGELHY